MSQDVRTCMGALVKELAGSIPVEVRNKDESGGCLEGVIKREDLGRCSEVLTAALPAGERAAAQEAKPPDGARADYDPSYDRQTDPRPGRDGFPGEGRSVLPHVRARERG